MNSDIKNKLLTHDVIAERVASLAQAITHDYEGKEFTIVALMKGSIMFLADLLRLIPIPLRLETINVASYHSGTESSRALVFKNSHFPDIKNRHILLVDDILESGVTLKTVGDRLMEEGALSLRCCVLLHKNVKTTQNVDAHYIGFEIADEFVVGYGLDYQELYRNLPDIAILSVEAIANCEK